jgi:hypothetical protein
MPAVLAWGTRTDATALSSPQRHPQHGFRAAQRDASAAGHEPLGRVICVGVMCV